MKIRFSRFLSKIHILLIFLYLIIDTSIFASQKEISCLAPKTQFIDISRIVEKDLIESELPQNQKDVLRELGITRYGRVHMPTDLDDEIAKLGIPLELGFQEINIQSNIENSPTITIVVLSGTSGTLPSHFFNIIRQLRDSNSSLNFRIIGLDVPDHGLSKTTDTACKEHMKNFSLKNEDFINYARHIYSKKYLPIYLDRALKVLKVNPKESFAMGYSLGGIMAAAIPSTFKGYIFSSSTPSWPESEEEEKIKKNRKIFYLGFMLFKRRSLKGILSFLRDKIIDWALGNEYRKVAKRDNEDKIYQMVKYSAPFLIPQCMSIGYDPSLGWMGEHSFYKNPDLLNNFYSKIKSFSENNSSIPRILSIKGDSDKYFNSEVIEEFQNKMEQIDKLSFISKDIYNADHLAQMEVDDDYIDELLLFFNNNYDSTINFNQIVNKSS